MIPSAAAGPSGIQNRGASRTRVPRRPALSRRLLEPAAQQAADFRHHGAYVLVLPGAEPAPVVGQAKIEPQPAQCHRRRRGRRVARRPSGSGLRTGLSCKSSAASIIRRVSVKRYARGKLSDFGSSQASRS